MPSQVASCTHTERFYFLFPPIFLVISPPQENSPTLVITETARLHLSQHQFPLSLTLPCYFSEALPASRHVACCLQAQAMLLRLRLELELAVPLPLLAAVELRAQPDVAAVAAQLQLQQVEAAAVQQRLDVLPELLVLRLSTRTRIDVLGFQRCDAISP